MCINLKIQSKIIIFSTLLLLAGFISLAIFNKKTEVITPAQAQSDTITINASQNLGSYDRFWGGVGHGWFNHGTLEDPYTQINDLYRSTNPKNRQIIDHIRTTNMYCTDADPAGRYRGGRIYIEDGAGNPEYNWTYFRSVLGNIRADNITPLITTSFIPRDLAADASRECKWSNCIDSAPDDYIKWRGLVTETANQLINIYGINRASNSIFEVWSQPDLPHDNDDCTMGDVDSGCSNDIDWYNQLYDETASAIKAVDSRLKVGGPSVAEAFEWNKFSNQKSDSFFREWVHHVDTAGSPVDAVFIHAYGRASHIYKTIEDAVNIIEEESAGNIYNKLSNGQIELQLTEVMPTDGATNLPEWLNERYAAAWAVETIAALFEIGDNRGPAYRPDMTYVWSRPSPNDFKDHWGLTTMIDDEVIKKPIFNAYHALGYLGGERIGLSGTQFGDNIHGIATQDDSGVQLILYHIRNNDRNSNSSYTDTVDLDFINLPFTDFTLKRYVIDEDHSNSYTLWKDGQESASVLRNNDDLEEVESQSRQAVGGRYNLSVSLQNNSVMLVLLETGKDPVQGDVTVDVNQSKGTYHRFWGNWGTGRMRSEAMEGDANIIFGVIKDINREIPGTFRWFRSPNMFGDFRKNVQTPYICNHPADCGDWHGVYNEVSQEQCNQWGAEFKDGVCYDWSAVDAVYDRILDSGMKPIVELTFMPRQLISADICRAPECQGNSGWYYDWRDCYNDRCIAKFQQSLKGPADPWINWQNLIKETVLHFASRYGRDEVESWYFEVWNEPEHPEFWGDDLDSTDFLRLYDYAIAGIEDAEQELNATIIVGGLGSPGVNTNRKRYWLSRLLTEDSYAGTGRPSRSDFHSYHIYTRKPNAISNGAYNYVSSDRTENSTVNIYKNLGMTYDFSTPTLMTEYGLSTSGMPKKKRPWLKYAFPASWYFNVIDNFFQQINQDGDMRHVPNELVSWLSIDHGSGSNAMGMMTDDSDCDPEDRGLGKRPLFNAFQVSGMLGPERIDCDSNSVRCFATKHDEQSKSIQVVAYRIDIPDGDEIPPDTPTVNDLEVAVNNIPFAGQYDVNYYIIDNHHSGCENPDDDQADNLWVRTWKSSGSTFTMNLDPMETNSVHVIVLGEKLGNDDWDNKVTPIPSCSDQGGGTCASSTYCTDIIPSRDNPKCCLPENCQPKTADFNCNDYVDIYDFGILMSCWGYYNPSCASAARGSCTNYPDINEDDDVGSSEFAAIMSQWGQ